MSATSKIVAAGLITLLAGAHTYGGMINLVSFVETPTTFESEWEWTNAGNNWTAANLLVGQFWQVEMRATNVAGGLGDLRDTSRHIVNPHGGEILPPLSWWDYAGASNGFPLTPTWIEHPGMGHFDLYTLTALPAGPGVVTILFEGMHPGPPDGHLRYVPAPASCSLLAIAGLMTLSRRR